MVEADHPPSIVDVAGIGLAARARGGERGERAVAQYEPASRAVVVIPADDLAVVVDAEGQTAARGAGNIDGREDTSV